MALKINFGGVPEAGTVIDLGAQIYKLAGARKHIKASGRETTLLEWETVCASCAAPMVTSTPLRISWVSRRCGDCKQPGKPVAARRE